MNNKGFTLIELIMTIMIIAMLALFATPNVIKMINQNKVDNYNAVIDSIKEAASLYAADNRYDLPFSGSCTPGSTNVISANVTIGTLIDSKALKANTKDSTENDTIENPCTKDIISRDTVITIKLNCSTKNFSYDIDETNLGCS